MSTAAQFIASAHTLAAESIRLSDAADDLYARARAMNAAPAESNVYPGDAHGMPIANAIAIAFWFWDGCIEGIGYELADCIRDNDSAEIIAAYRTDIRAMNADRRGIMGAAAINGDTAAIDAARARLHAYICANDCDTILGKEDICAGRALAYMRAARIRPDDV